MPDPAVLEQLIEMSHDLGRDDRRLASLGEGNTSAVADDGTFWVKGSRCQLGTLATGGVHPLTPGDVDRVDGRPDERFRGRQLGLK